MTKYIGIKRCTIHQHLVKKNVSVNNINVVITGLRLSSKRLSTYQLPIRSAQTSQDASSIQL